MNVLAKQVEQHSSSDSSIVTMFQNFQEYDLQLKKKAVKKEPVESNGNF